MKKFVILMAFWTAVTAVVLWGVPWCVHYFEIGSLDDSHVFYVQEVDGTHLSLVGNTSGNRVYYKADAPFTTLEKGDLVYLSWNAFTGHHDAKVLGKKMD